MKTLQEILENYNEYETPLEDRFGKRLCKFLTPEQAAQIGFAFRNEAEHKPKEWNEENILAQLKDDVLFGYEKCIDERAISASLMYEVVKAWCKVLENGVDEIPYYNFGREMFEKVASRYGWSEELAKISGT